METNYQTNDLLHEEIPAEKPKGLRVLTVLTIIGCILGYLGCIVGLFMTKDYETQHREMTETLDKAGSSGFARKMVESQLENMERNQAYFTKFYENRYILMGT